MAGVLSVNRLIIGSIGGALAGAALTYVLLGPEAAIAPPEVVRDIVVVEKMSEVVADALITLIAALLSGTYRGWPDLVSRR